MRVFKLKVFARFARREGIPDADLREAIERIVRGLVDSDLGGGLIKQRVARKGQGRSGGYRMLLAFRAEDRVIFLFGFAKSEQKNINDHELTSLRIVANSWLTADAAMLAEAIAEGLLIEVKDAD